MSRRAIGVAAVGVITLAIAAVAASGGSSPDRISLPVSRWQLQGFSTVMLVIVIGLGAVALVVARPARMRNRKSTGPVGSLLAAIAVIAVTLLFGLALRAIRGNEDGTDPDASATAGQNDGEDGIIEIDPGDVGITLFTVVAIGVVVAIAARVGARHMARPSGPTDDVAALREAVREGLEQLSAPLASDDHRRAILACWRVLEAELAAQDLPRHASETGQEYLQRVLAPLSPSPAAVDDLVARVEVARWSTHGLTDDDVAVARGALGRLLDDIGAPT